MRRIAQPPAPEPTAADNVMNLDERTAQEPVSMEKARAESISESESESEQDVALERSSKRQRREAKPPREYICVHCDKVSSSSASTCSPILRLMNRRFL